MGEKPTSKLDGFDDEMRARLVFYNQLAAGATQVDRVRRRRANAEPYRLPKDVADKFIERIGLAGMDEPFQVPVRRVAVEDERDFAPQHTDSEPPAGSAIGAGVRAVGHGLAAPFVGIRYLASRLVRPRTHYVAGMITTAARSHRHRMTLPGLIATLSVAILVVAIGAASYLYFHQRAAEHQRQAEQAQYERQRHSYLCSLARFEQQQHKPVTVSVSSCD
jgi:hypothetical protein